MGVHYRLNAPALGVAVGALGFWGALDEIFPETRHQRCWKHKTANVLNYLPKHTQPKAKEAIHEIWMAETKDDAVKAFDLFIETYQDKLWCYQIQRVNKAHHH